MKTCKSCHVEQSDEAFSVCKTIAGKTYRRQKYKRALTNLRRAKLRLWLDAYKQSLVCIRCGFADYCALEFHHNGRGVKDFNVADMIGSGLSVKTIENEVVAQ